MTPEQWESVRELFHAALDLSPDERPGFLRANCAEHSIRAEVESLLNAASNSPGPIDGPALEQARKAIDVALASDPNLPLLIGRTLGQYEIVSLLGMGGMGQVYRARDRRLKREVALKVLPGQFADDPERMARFQREAEVLASLNHPNIAQIYGIEDSALVMELVEGEILKGPLPLMTAAKYAVQIAEGLEYAHEKGVIHRDLKPANIKITPQGTVKILDFGLAKAQQNPLDSASQDASTLVTALQTGVVMGTPAYMSPEQASGHAVDKRADIWSFGVVLWEMVTGERLFHGQSVMQVLAEVLKAEIDFSRLPEQTPAPMRELLARCLDRDPRERLRDLGEARLALQKVLTEPASAVPTPALQKKRPAQVHRPRRWIGLTTLATAVAGVAAFSAWLYANRSPTVPGPEKWKQITHFPELDSATNPVISPDGHMLAFMRGGDWNFSPKNIWVKSLPDGLPVELTHDTVAKSFPAFSPDGLRIAYTVIGLNTWVVPVLAGGEPRLLLESALDLKWADSQHILFSQPNPGPSAPISLETSLENGIEQRRIYAPSDGKTEFSALSPDHKLVLLTEADAAGRWMPCRVVPFDGSSRGRQVGPAPAGCVAVAWSPDGKWMYFTADTGKGFHIWRQKSKGGDAEQITFGPAEQIGVAVAPDGRSLYTSSGIKQGAVYFTNASGLRPVSGEENVSGDAAFSPDGAFLYYRANEQIWRAELKTGRQEPLFSGLKVSGVSFSQGGNSVIYLMPDGGTWLADLNQKTPPRRIPLGNGREVYLANSGRVYFTQPNESSRTGNDLAGFSTFGGFRRSIFTDRDRFVSMLPDGNDRRDVLPQLISRPRVSPDERMVVGNTAEAGTAAFPLAGGEPRLVCRGCLVDWSSDGRTVVLSFRSMATDPAVIAVPLQNGAMLPPLPAEGFRDPAEVLKLPGAIRLPLAEAVALGPDLKLPASIVIQDRRNIFQIPLR